MEKYKEKLKITRVYATRDEIEIKKGVWIPEYFGKGKYYFPEVDTELERGFQAKMTECLQWQPPLVPLGDVNNN